MKQFIVNKIKLLPDKLVEIKMYINLPFIRGGETVLGIREQ